MAISRSQIPQQVSKGSNKMMKKKGYKAGGKVKMKKGGKVSPRKMMAKCMMMGGKVKTKGMKRGGKVNNLKKAIKKVKAKTKKK